MKYCLYIILFFGTLSSTLFSQTKKRNFRQHEVGVFLGGAYYIGDLNPRKHFNLTQPAAGVFYRFTPNYRYAFRGGINWGKIMGDDSQSDDADQLQRNLNFKSNIFELSVRAEVSFFNSKVGHRYGIKKTFARRHKGKSNEFIGFIGIGGFYFNPKGQNPNTGKWEKLYPLHTEGQGLPGGPAQYKRISICIPMGIAWRMTLNKLWCVGLEFSYRKTFTDYIDDVSGNYVAPANLAAFANLIVRSTFC